MRTGYVWFHRMGHKTLFVRCTCRFLREKLLVVCVLVHLPLLFFNSHQVGNGNVTKEEAGNCI